jgi:hypothetical protein
LALIGETLRSPSSSASADYQYSSIDYYLRDQTSDLRTADGWFVTLLRQPAAFLPTLDDWRIRPNVTPTRIELLISGCSWGAKLQGLNAVASVPGLIEFKEPEVKGHFSEARIVMVTELSRTIVATRRSWTELTRRFRYDYIFDNCTSLRSSAGKSDGGCGHQLLQPQLPYQRHPEYTRDGITTPAAARAVTSAFIPTVFLFDNLHLSYQRQFARDWSLESLPRYAWCSLVDSEPHQRPEQDLPGRSLPTFSSRPTQARFALTLNLTRLSCVEHPAGLFQCRIQGTGDRISFKRKLNYNAFSSQLNRRFANGFQLTAAYTGAT